SVFFTSPISDFTDLGGLGTTDTPKAPTNVVATEKAIDLAFNATAAEVQDALEDLPHVGLGNVAVTLNDDVYVLRFQGSLSDSRVHQLFASNGLIPLTKQVEQLGGTLGAGTASATVTMRYTGFADPLLNHPPHLRVHA